MRALWDHSSDGAQNGSIEDQARPPELLAGRRAGVPECPELIRVLGNLQKDSSKAQGRIILFEFLGDVRGDVEYGPCPLGDHHPAEVSDAIHTWHRQMKAGLGG